MAYELMVVVFAVKQADGSCPHSWWLHVINVAWCSRAQSLELAGVVKHPVAACCDMYQIDDLL